MNTSTANILNCVKLWNSKYGVHESPLVREQGACNQINGNEMPVELFTTVLSSPMNAHTTGNALTFNFQCDIWCGRPFLSRLFTNLLWWQRMRMKNRLNTQSYVIREWRTIEENVANKKNGFNVKKRTMQEQLFVILLSLSHFFFSFRNQYPDSLNPIT